MSSDFSTAKAAYHANNDYDLTGSITKARAFVVACRDIIISLPTVSESEKSRSEFNLALIEGEKKTALAWLKDNDPSFGSNQSSCVVFPDFREARG